MAKYENLDRLVKVAEYGDEYDKRLAFVATGELATAERCAADLERWTEEGRQGLAVRDSEIARLYTDLEAARKRIAELETLPFGGLIDAWTLMNLDAQGEIRDINASLGRNLDIVVAKLTGLEYDEP